MPSKAVSMATLQLQQYYLHPPISYSPKLLHFKNPNSVSYSKKLLLCSKKISGFLNSRQFRRDPFNGLVTPCKFSKESAEIETLSIEEKEEKENERPPFDINLAVILAGFAFEAYITPPENVGKREVDAANCQTVFLSELFVREIYDGQLFIKLKKGLNLPAMDLWGTSDPYVVFQLDSQVLKSKTKWGTKEPTWNEEFIFNMKVSPGKILQVAAWDANLVTPHKRMGNSAIELESICDGNLHRMVLDLEGMGGGGKIELEIKYKSFEKIDQEKQWWRIPIVTEFLEKYGFENLMKTALGSETVQARQFVEFAFGQIKTLNDEYLQKNWLPNGREGKEYSNQSTAELDTTLEPQSIPQHPSNDGSEKLNENQTEQDTESNSVDDMEGQTGEAPVSDELFWKRLADTVNQNVVQRFGLSAPQIIKWDGFDLLNKMVLESRKNAEAVYVESGLATPEDLDSNDAAADAPVPSNTNQSSLANIKKVTQELLQQTDVVLGALMVLNATVSKISKGAGLLGKDDDVAGASRESDDDISEAETLVIPSDRLVLDEKKAEEMRTLFSSAESAMEAWAMLATSLGHPSFIKSEFEKICFLDNPTTDTQVALWRDSARRRLVVAFRGTEQARWKDLRTDLMLVPAGLNPERIGGDFKQEVQVHSGFLSAYDSVRTRIIRLIKQVVGYNDDDPQSLHKWHVYVTGHSLGGALATLLALELASSQLAKHGAISVTMYNFGSPRVGNKKFAELYNEKVHDSWRVVNQRDIIPTVPRLMGYCHVAQPVYLAAGDLENALENISLMADGYDGDVLGESTPDVIVSEFMKGEKELIQKILNTEINIFLSIRDGSALMQHMEDFYYVTLLESVRSNYQTVARSQPNEEKSLSVG